MNNTAHLPVVADSTAAETATRAATGAGASAIASFSSDELRCLRLSLLYRLNADRKAHRATKATQCRLERVTAALCAVEGV